MTANNDQESEHALMVRFWLFMQQASQVAGTQADKKKNIQRKATGKTQKESKEKEAQAYHIVAHGAHDGRQAVMICLHY